MLEEKINKLAEKRKLMNSSDSFPEISRIWSEIKKEHLECKEEIKSILKELDLLNDEVDLDFEVEQNFDFDKSFSEIKKISEEIKTCSVSKFVENIKKISELKKKCFKYLSREKSQMEEVK